MNNNDNDEDSNDELDDISIKSWMLINMDKQYQMNVHSNLTSIWASKSHAYQKYTRKWYVSMHYLHSKNWN